MKNLFSFVAQPARIVPVFALTAVMFVIGCAGTGTTSSTTTTTKVDRTKSSMYAR